VREIRFRAWDYTQNKIRIVTDLMSVCDGSWNVSYDGGENYTGDIVLMQYTGLHDKKGKEIYEGDIIRECYTIFPDDMEVFISEVLFQNGSFQLSGEDYEPFSGESSMCSIKSTDLEVIGNVWENPELLGGAA